MYYSQLVKTACTILFQAHKDDLDKGGYPYVFHPFYLATQMDDEASTCVALLHDVVEDTDWTLERLSGLFPDAVVQAVALLTRDPALPYEAYLEPIRGNPLASRVKLADLEHNGDFSRLCTASGHWTERQIEAHRARYAKARAFLLGEE